MTTVAQTLADALVALQDSERGDRVINHIDGELDEVAISYRSLYQRALNILSNLQRRGVEPGAELLICTQSNRQFLDAFWACQLGGLTAVPVAVGHSPQSREKLFNVFGMLRRGFVFSNRNTLEGYQTYAQGRGESCLDTFSELHRKSISAHEITTQSDQGVIHRSDADDVALVQFSSGTTGSPKGVVLSHRNLLTNMRSIVGSAELSERDSYLSWMPLSHDMGLIGFHLVPLLLGGDQHLMPSTLFARRPLLWLNKAGDKHVSVLASPNFGYQHYLKAYRSKRPAAPDLSRVRLIFNGAEPISARVCDDFGSEMAACGLRADAIFPVYGLAEASLAVSFPSPGEPIRAQWVNRRALTIGDRLQPVSHDHADARVLVGVGRPVAGCEVRIADASGEVLPAATVGHIQIRGDNVSAAYYGAGSARNEAGWLDTGDLGVVDDQLYVVGREKDTIILNGVTYHSSDLESLCAELPDIEAGKVACVSVRGSDGESLVALVQHRGDAESFLPTAHAVKRLLSERALLSPVRVLPVRALPKTTSGKVQRHQLQQALLDGEFADMESQLNRLLAATASGRKSDALTELEHTLLEICRGVITTAEVHVDDDLFELGTSSLALAEISEEIDACFPGVLDLADFLEFTSVAALAARLEASLSEPEPGPDL